MKKNLLLLFILVFVFTLVGCHPDYDALLQEYVGQINIETEVTGDFHLPCNVENKDDHSISWSSSDTNIIKVGNIAVNNGVKTYTAKVTVSTEDKKVTLTATVELSNGLSLDKDFEVTVKGKPEEKPEPKPQIDKWPYEENKPYKFTLVHTKLNKTFYFVGKMNGFYFATSEDNKKAVDIYCEKVEGGYKLFFTKDGVKNYLGIEENGKHTNAVFGASKNTIFTWNKELQTMATKLGENTAFFGTSAENDFSTIGASKNTKPGAQCVVTLTESDGKPIEPEPTPQPEEGWGVINQVEAGKEYKLGLSQTNNNTLIYLSGKLNEKYPWFLLTTTEKDAAAKVTAVQVEGGFNLKVDGASGLKYINAKQDNEHYSIFLEDTATSVWTWDEAHKTFLATCGDKQVFIGTHGTFDTLSAKTIDKFDSSMIAHFYGKTEGQPVEPEPTPQPKPEEGWEVANTVEAGKEYKLGLIQENNNTLIYLSGKLNEKYPWFLLTTTDASGAAKITLVAVEGGFNIKVDGESGLKYINAKQDNGHYSIFLEDAATSVWTFDSAHKILITQCGDKQVFIGTHDKYDTLSAKTIDKLDSSFIAHLYVNTNSTPIEPEPNPQPETNNKISEVLAGAEGNYKVSGTIIAKNERSFIVADETGKILVYMGKKWNNEDVKIGDVVSVEGEVTPFMGSKQFGEKATVIVTGTKEVVAETPEVLDSAKLNEYLTEGHAVEAKLVTINGLLKAEGKYFNIYVSGSELICQVSYALNKDELNGFNDKPVEFTGYITGAGTKPYDNSGKKYANFIFVSVKLGEATDEIKFNFAKDELLLKYDGLCVRENLTLLTSSSDYNLVYAWKSTSEALKADGTYTAPAEDTTVKLTVDVKNGETVIGTVELNFTVKKANVDTDGLTFNHVFTTNELTSMNVVIDDLKWRFVNPCGYTGFDSPKLNRGLQIGSSSSKPENTVLSTNDYDGKIKTIVIKACAGSDTGATLKVVVNGVDVQTVNVNKENKEYTFNVNACGNIDIIFNQTESKAMYITSIKIN